MPQFITTIQSFTNKLKMNKTIKLINPATLCVAPLHLHSLRFSLPYSAPLLAHLYLPVPPLVCATRFSSTLFSFHFLPCSEQTTFSSSFRNFFSFIPQSSFGRDRGRAKDSCEGNDHILLSRSEEALRKENKNLHINRLVKLYISVTHTLASC